MTKNEMVEEKSLMMKQNSYQDFAIMRGVRVKSLDLRDHPMSAIGSFHLIDICSMVGEPS